MSRSFDRLGHHALMFGAGAGRSTWYHLAAFGDEPVAIFRLNHLLIVDAGRLFDAEHTDFTARFTELARLTAGLGSRSRGHGWLSFSLTVRLNRALFVR